MITVAWIDNEIDKAINGANTPQNIRDFALLCIARENLLSILSPPSESQITAKENKPVDEPKLSVYNADIAPTMDEVKDMFGRAVLRDESDKKKAKDMQTWMNIVGRKS